MGKAICLHQVLCLLLVISASSFSSSQLCPLDQSLALLQFRNTFTINCSASSKVISWKKGKDCCSWDGVTCDRLTGHVIGLDLSDSCLYGTIHSNSSLFLLPHLGKLNLANNDFNHSLISPEFGQFTSLEYLNLSNSLLDGLVPSEISLLSKLVSLDLSYNSMRMDQHIFELIAQNLTEIKYLHLNSVNMSLVVPSLLSLRGGSSVNYTLPNLEILEMSSCNISEFPNSLRSLENLRVLDLSNNQINGWISKWELKGWQSLTYLNLSHNFLSGLEQLPGKNLRTLDLRSNLLEGPFQVPSSSVEIYLDPHNKLSGEIPSVICNLISLKILDLSNNSLSGMLPKCLGNFSSELLVLSLRMNKFHGSIPGTFAKGNRIRNIGLNGNQLEGPLPRSLVNCSNLEVLDLGNNKINDTFPLWLDSLPELQVLILRSNRFYGQIDNLKSSFSFTKLRIIDLSHNEFTGLLPTRLLENLQAMMTVEKVEQKYMGDGYYADSVIITMKGLELKLVRILTIFTTIDMSSNRFQGQIPEVIGKLKSLLVLNLSHNSLTGHIPSSLGSIAALESLDLCWNKLVGMIPVQLTSLTFLEVLNLSHNKLEGPIPEGSQFATFENNSYSENSGLCGLPLSKKCSKGKKPQSLPSEDEDSGSGFSWKITMMGYGCGLVFGLSMGYIVFSTGKPWWFVRLVEGDQHKKVRSSSRMRQGRRN